MYSVFDKRFIALILAVLMLLAALTGCTVGGGDSSEDNSDSDSSKPLESESDSEPTPEDDRIVLASNGKSKFTIWVANDIYASYPDVVTQVNNIAVFIRSKTDASISVMSDASYSVRASKNAGILIGNTRFAESQELGSEMKNKDYYVGALGNKILLYGGDIDGISKAIRYFYITVLNTQKVVDKTIVFDPEEHTFFQTAKYDINSISCDGTELGKFNIVLPSEPTVNESYFAYSLRYWLYQKYGYRMDIVDEKAPEGENEILIGSMCGETESAVRTNEYSISVSDGKLCLAAGGMLAYDQLYSYITNELWRAGGSADYTLSADYSHIGTVQTEISDGSALTSAKMGDVRAMFYNVFGGVENYEDGTTTGPIPLRQSLQFEMIRSYVPDIVGFQEYNVNYERFVYMMTDLGYEQVPSNSTARNQNPIFFNNDTLRLIDSGYLVYTGIDDQKAASWAVFNIRGTDKSFVAISTHFMWNSPNITETEADSARESNAEELLALISGLRNKGYGELPIIVGGDFNCKSDSTPIEKLTNSGFTCAQEVARIKNDTNGHHSYSRYDTKFETYSIVYEPTGDHSEAIDHIFVTSGISVDSFAAITDMYALLASDHCPTVTDITIN